MKIFLKVVFIICCVMSPLSAFSSPMKFKLFEGVPQCQGCLIVQADGDITENTPKLFSLFVKKHMDIKNKDSTLILNSPGGNLAGGLQLGRLIRKHGLNTHIASFDRVHSTYFITILGRICLEYF